MPNVTFDKRDENKNLDGPKISINELFSLVRHSKFSFIKEALDYLPNKKFDKTLVQVIYFKILIIILVFSIKFVLLLFRRIMFSSMVRYMLKVIIN